MGINFKFSGSVPASACATAKNDAESIICIAVRS